MTATLRQTSAIALKEIGAYFGSPTALIFVGVFLLVTLLSFFWVETFYARNIADVRPLFERMPVLMIFLAGVLTMRQWSEEQRGGTMEVLLTLPVRRPLLVIGKFIGVMMLIVSSLAVTLVLPITVSVLGDLDWGPVAGGYVAALLMSSAYVAIGLFVSSRTDNQIVSFILAVLICSVLYVAGTTGVTGVVGETATQVLRAIGLGSRFESIERGVIDLRDLAYYVSLTAFFLLLNVVSLDMKRWSRGRRTVAYRRNTLIGVALVAANLVALNIWLFPLSALRLDLTSQQKYSLSEITGDLVSNLPEPLLLRGYFSERTHPLLAPLLPTIRDLMSEYEVASGGAIRVEIVDPREDEEVEAEANQAYGIRATPFRITERYEASVVNAYFDVLVRYGDQFVTLGLADLIEVAPAGGDDVDVQVGNLEYVLTRSIKKAVFGFQSLDSALQQLEEPIKLTLFATGGALPESLREVPGRIDTVAGEIAQESGGKLVFDRVDPDAEGSAIDRGELMRSYGLRPIASLFGPQSYYLHLLIQRGEESRALFPSGELSEDELRAEIESALKRSVPGFLKTVGLWHPSEAEGPLGSPISTWQLLRQQLSQTYTVNSVDLASGRVPGDVDVLVVVSPQNMADRERFAIDQFLMRGGAVVVAAGNYVLSPFQFGGAPVVEPARDGLRAMLADYGVLVNEGVVMDLQNAALPIQVQRNVGGFNVVEVEEIDYPPFVDVRRDGMAQESPIVSDVPSLTLYWASPLEVDPDKNRRRKVVALLHSTESSWLRTSTDLEPNLESYPDVGFPIEGEQKAWVLGVSIRGSFESFFKDRASPFENGAALPEDEQSAQTGSVAGTIAVSPTDSRLVVIGSSEFLTDAMLSLSRSQSPDRYLLNLQLVQNSIDWAVEDEDLLSIRSRGHYTRLLRPMEEGERRFWEAVNYAAAILAVMIIGLVWHLRRRRETPMPLVGGD